MNAAVRDDVVEKLRTELEDDHRRFTQGDGPELNSKADVIFWLSNNLCRYLHNSIVCIDPHCDEGATADAVTEKLLKLWKNIKAKVRAENKAAAATREAAERAEKEQRKQTWKAAVVKEAHAVFPEAVKEAFDNFVNKENLAEVAKKGLGNDDVTLLVLFSFFIEDLHRKPRMKFPEGYTPFHINERTRKKWGRKLNNGIQAMAAAALRTVADAERGKEERTAKRQKLR